MLWNSNKFAARTDAQIGAFAVGKVRFMGRPVSISSPESAYILTDNNNRKGRYHVKQEKCRSGLRN